MPYGAKPLPLPESLPGDFFVLVYDRLMETYVLLIDDKDGSSYDLGDDIQQMMWQFRRWGHPKLGDSCIDLARTFGSVQGVFKDGRTIPLFKREADKRSVWHKEKDRGRSLPPLRAT